MSTVTVTQNERCAEMPACPGAEGDKPKLNTSPSGQCLTYEEMVRPDLNDYCPASNLAFNEKIKIMMKNGEKVYHFAFGQAPFPIMDGMVKALAEHAHENAYLPVAGTPELRQQFVNFHRRYDKLDHLHRDQVIVAPGTKELIFLLLQVFHGDVLVISPSWTTYKPQTHLSRHSAFIIKTSQETEWKITPELLDQTVREHDLKAKNKLLIMCNPDNPTGAAYTASELQALSAAFRKHRVIVLSDEIYARLHYSQSHDTLARYYPEGTILSSGMSKWASAGGWRLGYHIYPSYLNALRDAVSSAASHTYSCAPAPMQYAVAQALQNKEETDAYIKHTARIMSAISNYCVRELRSVGVTVTTSHAGYYIFPNFEVVKPVLAKRGIVTGEQFCQTLFDETRVAVMAGGPAFLRPVDEFTTRLCYVNFDGSCALKESYKIGMDTPLTDAFVQQYAKPAYDGIQVLKTWILKQLEEE